MAATAATSFVLSKTLISSPKSFYPSTTTKTSLPLSSSFAPLPLKLKAPKPHFSTTTTTAAASSKISATISVGDKLPESTFSYFDAAGELQCTTVSALTASKTTVLFAVPGAFTPTCSQKHVPGFIQNAAVLKAKGVDTIACISVNDAFVMKAWKKDLNIDGDEVVFLSDGNGNFTKAIGVELDLSDQPVGLGVRSRRYSMLVEDGVVKVLNLEEGGAFTSSSAEDLLKVL